MKTVFSTTAETRATRARIGARVPAAAFLLVMLVGAAQAEVSLLRVVPSKTDPEITQFDDPHLVYVDREIVVQQHPDRPRCREQLLLWIPGTNGTGRGTRAFCTLAAELGYHVISIVYPNNIAATSCARDDDHSTFEAFRLALIEGGRASYQNGKELSIARADSIENRLIKSLRFLEKRRPAERWDRFLKEDGSLRWDSIAVGGQSQGGGHAALIGIKHEVARVLCFGAPKDYNQKLGVPAGWYGLASATPKERFFAFNHHQDPMGCTPEQLRRNLTSLGLDAFGPPAEVDAEPFPYRHARVLYTGFPKVVVAGATSEGAREAHGSAISAQNAERWREVWRYLLTE